MKVRNYRDLDVWKRAINLVIACYRVAERFPKHEVYALGSQLRRAGVSIAANLAEGHSRAHRKEYLQHLSISYGSLAEVETHLEIAYRLKYVSQEEYRKIMALSATLGRMLNGLKRSLRSSPRTPPPAP